MPKLGVNDELVPVKGTFGFSAAKIDADTLGASEYTLVTIVVDTSGSVGAFKDDLEKQIGEVVKACRHSQRAENLMVRVVFFADGVQEFHGFKKLMDCNPGDYAGQIFCGGMTALYDATYAGIEATKIYGKDLDAKDYTVNAVAFFITDGCENASTLKQDVAEIRDLLKATVKEEALESILTVLIGINPGEASQELEDFKNDAGLSQYVEAPDSDFKTLAKIGAFVSNTISSTSAALGTGGPSAPLNF